MIASYSQGTGYHFAIKTVKSKDTKAEGALEVRNFSLDSGQTMSTRPKGCLLCPGQWQQLIDID